MASATDDFNRVESPLAGNWTQTGGQLQTNTNQLGSSGSTDNFAYWNAVTFANDQYSEATITTLGTTDNHALAVRMAAAPTKTYYFCDFGAVKEIGKFVASTITHLKTVSVTINTNDVCRCEVVGTTIYYKVNGVTIDSVTDSAIASGQPGVFLSTTEGRFDNWAAADVSATSAALTGTATGGITEQDVVAGGKVITVTLTGDTFITV